MFQNPLKTVSKVRLYGTSARTLILQTGVRSGGS